MKLLNNERALVVFSGGQDSTTCLFWAKRQFKEVFALSFRYGQKHANEVELAERIAREAGVHFQGLEAPLIGQLGRNSLTDASLEMDAEQPEGSFPNTFVPGRNLFFLSIAAVYAREHDIRHLVTGVSQTDFSGYPDCRDSFMKSLNVTLNLALADELGVLDLVRNETLTCYNGVKGDGCGHCPACTLRRRGLEEYLALKDAAQKS